MDISENRKRKDPPRKNRFNSLIDQVKDFVFFYGDDIPICIFCIGITILLCLGVRSLGKYYIHADKYVNANFTYQVGSIVERDSNPEFSIYDYLDSISVKNHTFELLIESNSSIYKLDNINPDIVLFKDRKDSAKIVLKSKGLSRYNYSTSNKLSDVDYILGGKLNSQDTLIIQVNLDYIGKYVKIKRVD